MMATLDPLTTPAPMPPNMDVESLTITPVDNFDTPYPTPRPTTPNPTPESTPEPTPSPTPKPTSKPTPRPTPKPTFAPMASPTEPPGESPPPSSSPSPIPSASVTPSVQQSPQPSWSLSPSATPSDSTAPTSDERHAGLKITLVGVRSIEDVSDWEGATARFYEGVYNCSEEASGVIADAMVEITLTKQNTKGGGGRTSSRRGRILLGRNLQQQTMANTALQSVVVTYSQVTTYRSWDPEVVMDEILKLPLSTEIRREEYAALLRGSLEGYEELTLVSGISIPRDGGGADGASGGGGGGELSTGYIIVIACGCAALLIFVIGAFLYFRTRRGSENSEADIIGCVGGGGDSGGAHHGIFGTSSWQELSSAASGADGEGPTLGDMSVASEPSGAGMIGASPCAGSAAEELLTIRVPAGRLGVVIDSPDVGGAPVIHAVKDSSVIADEVRVGDRIVAVDGVDVRRMSAIDVSRFISRKSSRPRKLTLVRYVYAE